MKTIKLTLFALFFSLAGYAQSDCSFDMNQYTPACGQEKFFSCHFYLIDSVENGAMLHWEFGDGTILDTNDASSVNHTFQDAGEYNILLRIDGSTTCEFSKKVIVRNKCAFDVYHLGGLKYQFSNDFIQGGDTAFFDFGDGTKDTSISKKIHTHCFPNIGPYPVHIEIRNSIGNFCCVYDDIIEVEYENCYTNFTYERLENDTIKIIPSMPHSPGDSLTDEFYYWYHVIIKDIDNTPVGIIDDTCNANDSLVFKYYLPGYNPPYYITMIKYKIGGIDYCTPDDIICVDSVVHVIQDYCKAEFKYKKIENAVNLPIYQFNANYTEGNQSIYTWDFGDGFHIDNDIDPIHIFNTNGTYSVCLTVYNISSYSSGGGTGGGKTAIGEQPVDYDTICSDFICTTIDISNISTNCIADFKAVGEGTHNYHFTADTIAGTNSYTWDFALGDGFSYHIIDTTIEYDGSINAVYNICLIVGNTTEGCMDTVCKTIMIGSPVSVEPVKENVIDSCIISLTVDTFYIYDVVEDSIKIDYYDVIWTIKQDNGDIITIPSEYNFPEPGVYDVELVIHCGKESTTTLTGKILIRDNPGIINVINKAIYKGTDVYIYPNPANNKLNISVNSEISRESDIQVLNSLGQVIFSKKYDFSRGTNIIALDIDNLGHGLYFVKINTADNTIARKFVK